MQEELEYTFSIGFSFFVIQSSSLFNDTSSSSPTSYRSRVEALQNEVGEQWLTVYNQIQQNNTQVIYGRFYVYGCFYVMLVS